MSSQDLLSRLRERGLAAWQSEFVQSFVKEGASPFQILLAPPGTGKTHTSVAAAAELTREGAKRILVLAPPAAALCAQWAASLREAVTGVPVSLVDRRAFRELEASTPLGASAWITEGIFVVSQDFAKLDDIASFLSTASWDLVIVDEAHRVAAPQRAALLRRLFDAGAVKRLLLLLAVQTPAFDTWISSLLDHSTWADSMITTDWYGPLKNWDGSVLGRPRLSFEIVLYTRGPDEIEFLRQLQAVIPALEEGSKRNRFLAHVLLQRASSSLFALEESLQALRHTLVSADELFRTNTEEPSWTQSDLEFASGDLEPSPTQPSSTWVDKPTDVALVEQCLSLLDDVSTDEKLLAVTRLVRSILVASAGEVPGIYVFSTYSDTVSYVHTAFEDAGLRTFKLTGSSQTAEVGRFLSDGGLLVCTDASLQGLELPQVSHLIHYDIPPNPVALEVRESRFSRYGRDKPCTVYLLRDGSEVMPQESRLMEMATSARRSAGEDAKTTPSL